MSDSDRKRSVDTAGIVATLQSNNIQFWQFMVGQRPNCAEIKPTPTSWCGMTTIGIQNLKKLVWFSLGVSLAVNNGSEIWKAVGEVLKWMAK